MIETDTHGTLGLKTGYIDVEIVVGDESHTSSEDCKLSEGICPNQYHQYINQLTETMQTHS